MKIILTSQNRIFSQGPIRPILPYIVSHNSRLSYIYQTTSVKPNYQVIFPGANLERMQ